MAKTTKTTKTKEEKIDLTGVKDELKGYVDISIKKAIKEELDKSNKRLIREKNKRILTRNIIILILLIIIALLLVLMYKNRFFNKYLGCETNSITTKETKTVTAEEVPTVTKDDLIKEFAYLLENVKIHEDSEYIEEFYSGKLSNEIKNYLAFNNLDIASLGTEDDYNIFDSSLLRVEYDKLFNSHYEGLSFNYLNDKVRYIDKMDSYITNKVLDSVKSNIQREIIDISVDDDTTVFTCVEGVLKDNHLYNVLTKKEVKYNKGSISDYEEYLTKVVYTFVNGRLESIK